jgi:hypothetical protein
VRGPRIRLRVKLVSVRAFIKRHLHETATAQRACHIKRNTKETRKPAAVYLAKGKAERWCSKGTGLGGAQKQQRDTDHSYKPGNRWRCQWKDHGSAAQTNTSWSRNCKQVGKHLTASSQEGDRGKGRPTLQSRSHQEFPGPPKTGMLYQMKPKQTQSSNRKCLKR